MPVQVVMVVATVVVMALAILPLMVVATARLVIQAVLLMTGVVGELATFVMTVSLVIQVATLPAMNVVMTVKVAMALVKVV